MCAEIYFVGLGYGAGHGEDFALTAKSVPCREGEFRW